MSETKGSPLLEEPVHSEGGKTCTAKKKDEFRPGRGELKKTSVQTERGFRGGRRGQEGKWLGKSRSLISRGGSQNEGARGHAQCIK